MQVLNLKPALRDVFGTAGHAIGSAVRSTSFLAAFVGLYSSTISLHRKLFSGDHKLVYYVAGEKSISEKQDDKLLCHVAGEKNKITSCGAVWWMREAQSIHEGT